MAKNLHYHMPKHALDRRIADVDGRLSGATEEYLRLRHRAKEAHAVSVREQRECVESRQKVGAAWGENKLCFAAWFVGNE